MVSIASDSPHTRVLNTPAAHAASSPRQTAVERSKSRTRVWLLLLVFTLGVFAAKFSSTLAAMTGQGDDLDALRDVFAMLQRSYVDKPDAAKLRMGAITGMLEALDDPYAEYIPPSDAKDFDKQMTGQFVGIGCQVESKDGWLTVVSPIEDSPAYHVGILAGDRITTIEGTSTLDKSIDDCIKMLTGTPKTPVNILVQRDGKEIPFTIIRDKIVSKSVRGFRRLVDGTGHWDYLIDPAQRVAYVRLSQFTPTSPKELFMAMEEAAAATKTGQLGGLILDLRNNPGGFMDAAIAIVDMFVDDVVIMSVRGRDQKEGQGEMFRAGRIPDMPRFPIVVLINGASASASEIVSGALQDHGRAVVVGERSFGKGLVQTVHPLPHEEGGQVKFTTQRYYLPSGRLIQRSDNSTEWGVDPSPGFYSPMTENQLIDWLTHRREQDILHKDTVPADFATQQWTDPDWISATAKDLQLAAAVKSMNTRLASGEFKPLGEQATQHGKIAEAELRALERTRLRFTREFARLDKRIEALEAQASTGKKPDVKNFWSDDIDLTGGVVNVVDKSGATIAKLKITGRDLERWLENADVELDKPEAASSQSPAADAPAPTPAPAPAPTSAP